MEKHPQCVRKVVIYLHSSIKGPAYVPDATSRASQSAPDARAVFLSRNPIGR
jgi:hypothetical protein